MPTIDDTQPVAQLRKARKLKIVGRLQVAAGRLAAQSLVEQAKARQPVCRAKCLLFLKCAVVPGL
jgi:hypothetical protein